MAHAVDIGTSLARHGFKWILYLNGHGSNIRADRHGGATGRLGKLGRARGGGLLPHERRGHAGGRRRPGVGPGRHGTRMRAGDQASTRAYRSDNAVFGARRVDENSFPGGKHSHMDWSDGPLAIMLWWNAISHYGCPRRRHEGHGRVGRGSPGGGGEECGAVRPGAQGEAAPGPVGAVGTARRREANCAATFSTIPCSGGGLL